MLPGGAYLGVPGGLGDVAAMGSSRAGQRVCGFRLADNDAATATAHTPNSDRLLSGATKRSHDAGGEKGSDGEYESDAHVEHLEHLILLNAETAQKIENRRRLPR